MEDVIWSLIPLYTYPHVAKDIDSDISGFWEGKM